MNELIKRLAKQAHEDVIKNTPSVLVTKEMYEQKFAKLVAEAEREACAKLCEDSWMAFSRTPNRRLDITPFPELEYVAKVIRARGEKA